MNMKSCIKKILGGMSLTCILVMSSCGDDGQTNFESPALPENVPMSVYEDFQKDFPEATSVEWSVSEGYAVATFTAAETRSHAGKTSVWYALKDAKKKMMCRTIASGALPEAVRTAFQSSEYAAWNLEETATLLTRYAAGTVETIYALEAREASGNAARSEVTLYYTASGVLVKLTAEVLYDEDYRDLERDFRDWLPQAPSDRVASFINQTYPQASYLYIYTGHEVTKVKILDGHQARLLLFDAAGNWISSQTGLHANELPEAVLTAFRANYADCRIDDAKECLTAAEGDYYLLTIKDVEGEKHEIRIQKDGTLKGDGNTDLPGNEGDEENGQEGETPEPDNGDTPDGDETQGDNNGGNDYGTYLKKTEIEGYLQQRYPNATITDRDYDEKGLEVELACNIGKIKVRFDLRSQGYVWTSSEWDLDYRQPSVTPTAIQETLNRSYANYQLYFLKYHELASGETYYMAGLKSALLKREMKVKLDAEGNVLAEYEKP